MLLFFFMDFSIHIKKEKKDNLVLPLKNVIRLATEKDKKQEETNLKEAEKALKRLERDNNGN